MGEDRDRTGLLVGIGVLALVGVAVALFVVDSTPEQEPVAERPLEEAPAREGPGDEWAWLDEPDAPPASARARFVCVHSRPRSSRSIDPNARSSWISMPLIVRDAREFETRDEASLEIDRSTPPNPAVSRARRARASSRASRSRARDA